MRLRVVAFSFLLVLIATLPAVARNPPASSPPARAPDFSLPGRQGTVSLAGLAGKIVYVDFWASWCEPCRLSFPWLRTLHERYATNGLTIVAINLDKDRRAADRFLAEFPAQFLVAFDPAGKAAEAFNVSAMPSSFLVGPDGAILYSQAGFDPRETGTVEQKIKEALPQ